MQISIVGCIPPFVIMIFSKAKLLKKSNAAKTEKGLFMNPFKKRKRNCYSRS